MIGGLEADEDFEKGSFAAAIASQQRDALAGIHFQIGILKYQVVCVSLGYAG